MRCLLAFTTAVSMSLALAACARADSGASTHEPIVPASVATTASTRPAALASVAAGSAALPDDHAETKRYKIEINYPPLAAQVPLSTALHKTVEDAKRDFMQGLPDPKQLPEFADRQLQLLIDFKIAAQTNTFVSVRETGMSDTGGAHPLPIDATFVYDAQARRVITLDDLFVDPIAARAKLADYARAALMKSMMAQAPKPGEGSPEAITEWNTNTKQMIDDGTKPTAENFANFIVRAGMQSDAGSPGLTLIFPPYQVAAYVYGTQTVDVPAAVFLPYLKFQYRNAFGMTIAN